MNDAPSSNTPLSTPLAQIRAAVHTQLDPTAPASERQQASAFLDRCSSDPDAWRACLAIMFDEHADEHTQFFAMNCVQQHLAHRAALLSPDDTRALVRAVTEFVTAGDHWRRASPVCRNKAAQLVATLAAAEYPAGGHWPDFFDTLVFAPLRVDDPVRVDAFLRVVAALAADVISRDLPRSPAELHQVTALKDSMREHANARLVAALLGIVRQHLGAPLADAALDALRPFISWIDINLVAEPHASELLLSLLAHPAHRAAACACVREIANKGMDVAAKLRLLNRVPIVPAAEKALAAVDGAAADSAAFLERLARLVDTVGCELVLGYDELRAAGLLADGDAAALLGTGARRMLDRAVDLMLALLRLGADRDVDAAVAPFAVHYVQKLQRTADNFAGGLSPHRLQHVHQLLEALFVRMQFADDAEYEAAEEEAAGRDGSFRTVLDQLFTTICRVQPTMATQFVQQAVQAVLCVPGVEAAAFAPVECTLHLLHLLHDSLAQQHVQELDAAAFWTNCVALLVDGCAVSRHRHPAVACALMRLYVRFARYAVAARGADGVPTPLAPNNTAARQPASPIFVRLLTVVVDARGLRSPHEAVRARAAHAFVRLAKTLRNNHVSSDEFLGALLASLADLLVVDANGDTLLSYDDQLHVIEAAGLLIGSSDVHGAELRAVLAPLLGSLDALVAGNRHQPEHNESAVVCSAIAHVIAAVSVFSKGFVLPSTRAIFRSRSSSTSSSGTVSPSGGSAMRSPLPRVGAAAAASGSSSAAAAAIATSPYLEPFCQASDTILLARQRVAHSDEVRAATVTFHHRMVETIGIHFFRYLPVIVNQTLQQRDGCSYADVADFLRLASQMASRFKQLMTDTLSELLLPLTRTVFALIDDSGGGGGGGADEQRERRDVRQAFFQLLHTIVASGNADALYTEGNAAWLADLLAAVAENVARVGEPSVQKTALGVLRRLAALWDLTDDASAPAVTLRALLYERVGPLLFELMRDARFDCVGDAQCAAVLLEAALMLAAMQRAHPQQFAAYVGEQLLPHVGVADPSVAAAFCEQLHKCGENAQRSHAAYKRMFRDFVRNVVRRVQ